MRATKPLVVGGSIIRELEVAFSGGRAVASRPARAPTSCAATPRRTRAPRASARSRSSTARDASAPLGTTFFDTLLDENAASHIALGSAYGLCLDDDADIARINQSGIHVDFMIGSPEMTVTGLTADGERVPALMRGEWAL